MACVDWVSRPVVMKLLEAIPYMRRQKGGQYKLVDIEDAVQEIAESALRRPDADYPPAYWYRALKNRLASRWRKDTNRRKAEAGFRWDRTLTDPDARDDLIDACATPSGQRLLLDELGLRPMSRRARCYHRKRVRRD